MEEKTFKIVLADGTPLEGLGLNGNNFISSKKLTEDTFEGNLSHVVIEDSEGNTEEHDNMALVQIAKYGKEYWFVLRELSAQEIRDAKTQANIEYIAMMTDIDLDE
ncbi:MAG: hypothetical protein PUD03_04070 [Lachnospiraceae bacterium]|nr:hypothetical protein [Lachnospiraceae bacterium]